MPAAKPIGSRRITERGYVLVKMYTGQRRWSFEHRAVWEAAHGPMPPGSYIHHLNNDPRDNRLENLQLVPSNSHHHRVYHAQRPESHRQATSRGHRGLPKSSEHRARIGEGNRRAWASLDEEAKLRRMRLTLRQYRPE